MERNHYTCFRRSVEQLGRLRKAAWAAEKAGEYSPGREISHEIGRQRAWTLVMRVMDEVVVKQSQVRCQRSSMSL